MMGGAAVAAALSVSPAYGDSQVVVRGLSFPADSAFEERPAAELERVRRGA